MVEYAQKECYGCHGIFPGNVMCRKRLSSILLCPDCFEEKGGPGLSMKLALLAGAVAVGAFFAMPMFANRAEQGPSTTELKAATEAPVPAKPTVELQPSSEVRSEQNASESEVAAEPSDDLRVALYSEMFAEDGGALPGVIELYTSHDEGVYTTSWLGKRIDALPQNSIGVTTNGKLDFFDGIVMHGCESVSDYRWSAFSKVGIELAYGDRAHQLAQENVPEEVIEGLFEHFCADAG